MTRALVPLADGVEEMEAVIIIDVLRRAGWEVAAAGLKPGPVRGSRGVVLAPDCVWGDEPADAFDALVLPGGGGGTERLRADGRVLDAVRSFVRRGRTVAAVCAAPLVLLEAGVLEGRRVTCHPGVRAMFEPRMLRDGRVVSSPPLLTGQGPGTCFDFALALVEQVDGAAKAAELAAAMVHVRAPAAGG